MPLTKQCDFALSARFDLNDHLLFMLAAHAIDGTKDFYNVPGISNPPESLRNSTMLFAAKTTLCF